MGSGYGGDGGGSQVFVGPYAEKCFMMQRNITRCMYDIFMPPR